MLILNKICISLSLLAAAGLITAAFGADDSGIKNPTKPLPLTRSEGGEAAESLTVTSAFKNGQVVPRQFTGDGGDQSPPLRWSAAPSGTRSFTVLCFDPDAPRGTWYHWLLYNLPPQLTAIGENLPKTATVEGTALQGLNDFNHLGYNGPAPPPGAKHRYYLRVLALDNALALRAGARKEEVLAAVHGHVLAQGEIMGYYWR